MAEENYRNIFEHSLEGLPLADLIHEIAKVAEETFPKNIAITTEVEPGVSAVRGDVSQLHQVVLNLCVNARDAMPQGGTLRLTASKVTLDETASVDCRRRAALRIACEQAPATRIRARLSLGLKLHRHHL